jgi:chemotaxis protein MotA
MDITTLAGLLLGIGGLFIGNILEGGHTGSLMQFTAGFIVLSGTVGATLVSNSKESVSLGFHLLMDVFIDQDSKEVALKESIRDIVDCTKLVKRESLVAIEGRLPKIKDVFLRRVLRNVVDGIDSTITRETFEAEIESEEDTYMAGAKVWSDAGGFAPTIGILGAVIGLIHVMGNLTDTSKLGAGIAVAFVATVYGVGLANLLFLPFSNKIKKLIEKNAYRKKVLLEGALLINSGLSSTVVDQRLQAFLHQGNPQKRA